MRYSSKHFAIISFRKTLLANVFFKFGARFILSDESKGYLKILRKKIFTKGALALNAMNEDYKEMYFDRCQEILNKISLS